MTRPPINLTAAEWASVQPDGTMWLAWEAGWPKACPLPDPTDCNGEHCDCPLGPPVEFVQACAPCETCGDQRIAVSGGPGYFKGGKLRHRAGGQTVMEIHCPDCRIELVGLADDVQHPLVSGADLTVTLGHAYAIGQPLPIVRDATNGTVLYWPAGNSTATDLTAALAHYGPPETLVGRWAIQLRVVGS